METLLVVAQHRNQYYSRSRAQAPARFRDINCRTFLSGAGILPTPFKACTTPVTKRACSSAPKTSSPSPSIKSHSEEFKPLKKTVKSSSSISSTIPIPINMGAELDFNDEFPFCELWAGPAYSNSPPPSSLPIPKFSVRPKRSVSLELPESSTSDINFHPIAKSAPPSPTRDHTNSSPRDLFHSADSATKTLRRILNLDIADG